MPRDRRAVIGTAIWNEPSIRALPYAQQHAYLLAYTQPDLNRCGVLAYRPKRWASYAADLTIKHLRRQYDALHASRHVVLDEDHEELLVRTYVGHDGLLAQPLVVAAMVRDYSTVTSPPVRVAVLCELRRLWDNDLTEAERKGILLLIGADVGALDIAKDNPKQAERIRGAIGDGLVDPMTTAIEKGQVDPFPKGPRDGLPEGLVEGLTNPHARAIAGVSGLRSPSPTPVSVSDASAGSNSNSDTATLRSGHSSPTVTREAGAL